MMRLTIKDDFDMDKIEKSGQCFRWVIKDDGSFMIPHRMNALIIRKISHDTYELSCDEDEFDSVWRAYLDLDTDYESIRKRVKKDDDFLLNACEAQKGIRILRQDPWETLISFIISQNRNIPAIKKSIELLCERGGIELRDSEGDTFYSFPTPDAIVNMSEEMLDECKLGYRKRYVKEAAISVKRRDIDLKKLKNEDAIECMKILTGICGVGIKVASCMMLFGLHMLDAFPIDVWMKKIIKNEYPDGYDMERYRPYNGIYQQYMFAYYRDLTSTSSNN